MPELSAADQELLTGAVERILAIRRGREDSAHMSPLALERLDQAERALLEFARASLGTERADAMYAEAHRRAGSRTSAQPARNHPPVQPSLLSADAPDAQPQEARPTLDMGEGATTAPQAADVGQFDGSADPNPGGRMGMGWHLTMRDGREFSGQAEEAAASGNTNNQAEYLALLALLDEYRAAGGGGPLIIRGDSQLVISQMNGLWRVRHPALVPLYDRARAAVKAVPGGVRFEWVPRHLNARADHLAGGRGGEPPAPPEKLTYAASPMRDVAAPLAGRIAALNTKGSASVKEYLALRVGGKDRCSLMPWGELAAAAGPECVRACAEAFPDDQRSQAATLRWALRGLAVQHAIKKVRADQQVLAARDRQT